MYNIHCIYIYIYIYIYNIIGLFIFNYSIEYIFNIYILKNCLCGSVAKASDTQAVGHGFDPRPDH